MIWERFLAALAAGIREELWFRFGLMTLLVWGGAQIMRTTSDHTAVLWAKITRFLEIGTYPIIKGDRFADIENRALRIFHQVDAWFMW